MTPVVSKSKTDFHSNFIVNYRVQPEETLKGVSLQEPKAEPHLSRPTLTAGY